MSVKRRPRLADPSDVGRLLSGDHVHHEWPPSGTSIQIDRPFSGSPWVFVVGEPTSGEDGDWWVTTVAEMLLVFPEDMEEVLGQLATRALELGVHYGSVIGNWPVIYEQGSGIIMRYLKSTFRGTLGTVEQFQFQMCWGQPGDDPTLTEAEQLTMAEDIAGAFATQWVRTNHGQTWRDAYSADVKFREVGVVQETLNTAVNADGTGGDLEQDNATQWAAFSIGSEPTGVGTASLPYEVACAVTLNTEHRGQSGRGRLYLPPFASTRMAAGGRFDPTWTEDQLLHLGDVVDAVKVATGLVPVVVSKRRKILNEITSMSIGSVPDSQRRRRRSQDELRIVGWTA